jgi:hypothetical protein
MDPIHPIAPGPPAIPRGASPVERPERITRERDRPSRDRQQRGRREPPPAPESERTGDDGEHPHIDVRA